MGATSGQGGIFGKRVWSEAEILNLPCRALILKQNYEEIVKPTIRRSFMKSKLLCAALAGLALASNSHATETPKAETKAPMGECYGVNECKGKGQCGTKTHSCAGQNACKGQGWITMTEKVCKEKKGQWKKASGMMHGTTKQN